MCIQRPRADRQAGGWPRGLCICSCWGGWGGAEASTDLQWLSTAPEKWLRALLCILSCINLHTEFKVIK